MPLRLRVGLPGTASLVVAAGDRDRGTRPSPVAPSSVAISHRNTCGPLLYDALRGYRHRHRVHHAASAHGQHDIRRGEYGARGEKRPRTRAKCAGTDAAACRVSRPIRGVAYSGHCAAPVAARGGNRTCAPFLVSHAHYCQHYRPVHFLLVTGGWRAPARLGCPEGMASHPWLRGRQDVPARYPTDRTSAHAVPVRIRGERLRACVDAGATGHPRYSLSCPKSLSRPQGAVYSSAARESRLQLSPSSPPVSRGGGRAG